MTETTPTTPTAKKLSEQQTMEMLKNWKNLCDLSKKRERTLLQLLRHPDATIEQIDEARKVYATSYKRLWEAKQKLIQAEQHGKLTTSYMTRHFIHESTITLTN